MGKVVKKVAKVAAIGAALYFGGSALASTFGTGAAKVGSTKFWLGSKPGLFSKIGSAATKIGGAAFKYASANPISTGSFLMQGGGMVAQNRYASAAADDMDRANAAQQEINRINLRKSNVRARNILMQKQQQNMIIAGKNLNSLGPFGPGTSSYQGAQGAIKSDYANVVGEINMAQGMAGELSAQQGIYGDAMTSAKANTGFASGASNITTAGTNIFKTLTLGDTGLYSRSITTPMV
tara:strand:+ start:1374 stop:2084 length:711 start_codon:yes stop_codon:yes gene_type:complete